MFDFYLNTRYEPNTITVIPTGGLQLSCRRAYLFFEELVQPLVTGLVRLSGNFVEWKASVASTHTSPRHYNNINSSKQKRDVHHH